MITAVLLHGTEKREPGLYRRHRDEAPDSGTHPGRAGCAKDGLRTAQEGQITDRYTKAVEQLGSGKAEVRLGGIYALNRLTTDSPRDRLTILNVLAAYARVHAQDPPPTGSDKTRLAVDVHAALTVLTLSAVPFDLSYADFHGKNLTYLNLNQATLFGANLSGANLTQTRLQGAHLSKVNFRDAMLQEAKLSNAELGSADLRGANLSSADLSHAKLNANLRGANLKGAILSGAQLNFAWLEGANLQGVQGMTADEIRRVARTDATTRF